MSLSLKTSRRILATTLLSSLILTGCGADDASKAPEVENQPPTATIAGQNRALERETVILKANAYDIETSNLTYQWQSTSADVELVGANTAEISFVSPEVRNKESFDITLTVTDGDGASVSDTKTFTSEPYTQKLSIFGTVSAGDVVQYPELELTAVNKVAYATIVVEIGDQVETFTGIVGCVENECNAGTNSANNYYIELEIDEDNLDELIKISAIGHDDYNPGLHFVSLMDSYNNIKPIIGRDEFIDSEDYFPVNITNVTTAQFSLIDEALISLNLAELNAENYQTVFDFLYPFANDDVIKAAHILKVVKDYIEYQLPEGIADTLALIQSEELYSALYARVVADTLFYTESRKKMYGSRDLMKYIDTDMDGELDIHDRDADGDGYFNRIEGDELGVYPSPRDFYPEDELAFAPKLKSIDWVDAFPDDNYKDAYFLKTCVLQSIRFNDLVDEELDEQIVELDLHASEFTIMNCAGQTSLADIENLQYFTELTYLDLSNTAISDVSSLQYLTKLTTLKLANINATDFSMLQSLTNLKNIDISLNKVDDASFISNLLLLEDVQLKSIGINDVSVLQNNVKITMLDVSGNNIQNLSPIDDLKSLVSLNASDNSRVSTLPSFTDFNVLQSLDLSGNIDLSNINNLVNLSSSLQTLKITNTKIDTLPDLSSLTGLKTLNLSNNLLNNVQGLTGLSNLEVLNVSFNELGNELANVVTISALPKLVDVNLSNNLLTAVEAFSANNSLKALNLFNNSLSDLSNLSNLSNLTELNLSQNQLINIAPIASLTNLDVLALGDNAIEDISPLSALSKLSQLKLYNNPIVAVEHLLSLAEQSKLPNKLDMSKTLITIEHDEILLSASIQQGSRYVSAQAVTFKKDIDVTYLPHAFDINSLSSSVRGESRIVEREEGTFCLTAPELKFPICWVSPHYDSPHCTAEEGSEVMNCNYTLYPEYDFTIEADFGPQSDFKFIADFKNRDIYSLLGTTFYEDKSTSKFGKALTCSAHTYKEADGFPIEDKDNLTKCTVSSRYIENSISWIQNHELKSIPRCRGIKGETVARCTPTARLVEDDPELGTDTVYSFDVDLSTIGLIERQATSGPGTGAG